MFETRIGYKRNINTATREVELVEETMCWDTAKDQLVAVVDSHTTVIPPGSDLTGLDAETAALCRGIWTPASVQEFDKKFAAQMVASQKMRAQMLAAQTAEIEKLDTQKAAIEERVRNLQTLVEVHNKAAEVFEQSHARMKAQERVLLTAYNEVAALTSDAAVKMGQAHAVATAKVK
jgi:cell division protein FtsB